MFKTISAALLAVSVLAGQAEGVHAGEVEGRNVLAVGHEVLEFEANRYHFTNDYTCKGGLGVRDSEWYSVVQWGRGDRWSRLSE